MAFDWHTQRTVIIAGAVVGIIFILAIPYAIIQHNRRNEAAANLQKNNERLFREQELRIPRATASSAGDLEDGLGNRGDARVSPYYGGMAYDSDYGVSRTVDVQPQVPAPAYVRDNSHIPSVQLSSRYGSPAATDRRGDRARANSPAATPVTQYGLFYNDAMGLARHEDDVPPAYTAAVPRR